MMQRMNALVSNNQRFLPLLATITLFFAVYGVGASFAEGMRDPQVFFNLFRTSPFYLISAIGMTFVILTGGIDLSVSGVVVLTTVASAALLRTGGWNAWAVMLLMLAMGTLLGAIMGAFITFMKVQPFIATLAGMWFCRGMCFFISDDAIKINDPVFKILGQTKILIPGLADPVTKQGDYISILVVVELVVVLVAIYIAHYTRFGRTVYAIGGNEQSARLMGLPVDSTKLLVYTLNGFCSALAGLTLAIYVLSGHGWYVQSFELDVIASVVMGGTMLTGGAGYVFGTVFGVLIRGLIQTLIQFNGQLSSWWTSIVIGLLTLFFIGVQSLLSARKSRQLASRKMQSQAQMSRVPSTSHVSTLGAQRLAGWRNRQMLLFGGGAVVLIVLAAVVFNLIQNTARGPVASVGTPAVVARCQLKPFRQEQVVALMKSGSVLAYERNGGPNCIDEIFAVYSDGRIVGDNGANKIDKQITGGEVDKLLADINDKGWFTEEMYSTSHPPCEQCFSYYLTVSFNGKEKTVQAVDGGTDAPANYWQVVSRINGVIPKFASY